MADAVTGTSRSRQVAVIGGGWAGCAAATTLAAAGVPVTLFEQATTLGGRARRVMHDGIALDNGQHLLIGAYQQTLELVALVHGADRAAELFDRLPLTLRPFGPRQPNAMALTAWRAPAPLHLAGGVLAARGLTFGERMALLADFRRLGGTGFRRPATETVAECFATTPRRAFDAIWKPLCLAALNTPPEYASAAMFAHVLQAAFTGAAGRSDFVVPLGDLSASFPDAAARFIERNGGIICKGVGIRAVTTTTTGVTLRLPAGPMEFAAVLVAVGPHQLGTAIGAETDKDEALRRALAQVGAFAYESITTVYAAFAGPVPFQAPLMRLDDAPGQWVFDRSAALAKDATRRAKSLVAVVISAGGPHDALDHSTLATNVESQLRRLAPDLPALVWSRVFSERRATYACTPGLARPAPGRVSPGIYLAGDYTDANFPATLEAATRSGVAAARALIASLV